MRGPPVVRLPLLREELPNEARYDVRFLEVRKVGGALDEAKTEVFSELLEAVVVLPGLPLVPRTLDQPHRHRHLRDQIVHAVLVLLVEIRADSLDRRPR